MRFSLEALASGATIVGTLVSIAGLLHGDGWVIAVSVVVACFSISAFLFVHKGRISTSSVSTVIEGHSIDSLNVANLRRRVNRSFFIQDVHHSVRIEGEMMEIAGKYSGYARVDQVSSFDFSMDADEGMPFAQFDCIGYDLGRDPDMRHPIRPLMIDAEGISKKLSIPFLEPLQKQQSFSILIKTRLPGTVKLGFGYYAATLSFAQDRVHRSAVQLEFVGTAPKEMRVYGSTPGKAATLFKTLPPSRRNSQTCEYLDVTENAPGQSSKIYVFWRNEA